MIDICSKMDQILHDSWVASFTKCRKPRLCAKNNQIMSLLIWHSFQIWQQSYFFEFLKYFDDKMNIM